MEEPVGTIERDNEVRRKERDLYWPMTEAAMEFFAEELGTHSELPTFQLTQSQVDGYAPWKILTCYEELCLRVVTKMAIHHGYELAPTQLHYAFVEAAWHCRRLEVDGKFHNPKVKEGN